MSLRRSSSRHHAGTSGLSTSQAAPSPATGTSGRGWGHPAAAVTLASASASASASAMAAAAAAPAAAAGSDLRRAPKRKSAAEAEPEQKPDIGQIQNQTGDEQARGSGNKRGKKGPSRSDQKTQRGAVGSSGAAAAPAAAAAAGSAMELDDEEDHPLVRGAVRGARAAASSASIGGGRDGFQVAKEMQHDDDDEDDDADDDAGSVVGDDDGAAGDTSLSVSERARRRGISEYEYQRLENIRIKNEQMEKLNLSSLIQTVGRDFPTRSARNVSSVTPEERKRKKQERDAAAALEATVRRSSLRSSVRDPNYVPPPPLYSPDWQPEGTAARPSRKEGALALKDVETLEVSDDARKRFDQVLDGLKNCILQSDKQCPKLSQSALQQSGCLNGKQVFKPSSFKVLGAAVRIVQSRTTCLSYHPTYSLSTPDKSILAAGDKLGNVSIAQFGNNVKLEEFSASVNSNEYDPHVGSVIELIWSGIDSHYLYSASRDGSVRRLNVEKQLFEEFFVEDDKRGESVSAMTISPAHDLIYVGDRAGSVFIVDARSSVTSREGTRNNDLLHYTLSEKALNSIALNPLNPNLFVTAGKDRVIRAWDLRHVRPSKPLGEWSHDYSINYIQFSPDGRYLVSTGYDNTMKIFNCCSSKDSNAIISPTNWASPYILRHDNHTGRWVTTFRTLFAPNSSMIAVGNMKRGIDVFGWSYHGMTIPVYPAAAIASQSGHATKQKLFAAAAASASSSSAPISSGGSAYHSAYATLVQSGTSGSASSPDVSFTLSDAEFLTAIPAALSWHPNRMQIAGMTASGKLYVFGGSEK